MRNRNAGHAEAFHRLIDQALCACIQMAGSLA